MCGPLAAAGAAVGLASAIGSSALSGSAAGQVASARNGVMLAQNAKMGKLYDEANTNFSDTLNKTGYDAQAADRTKAQADRTNTAVSAISAAPAVYNPTDKTGNDVVKGSNAAELAKYFGMSKDRAAADAAVNAYGDSTLNAGINLGRGAQDAKIIAGKMQRATAALPAQYAAADAAGNGDANWASILSGVGKVAGAAGAYGGAVSGAPTWGDLFGRGDPLTGGLQGPSAPGVFTRWFG